ncbi:MAG: sensor histidine kinase [Oceanobacter sp.]
MKRLLALWQPSLRLVLILTLLLLGGLLALGYSMVSTQYFFRGMDSVLARDMRNVMSDYLDLRQDQETNQRILASLSDHYQFADKWQQLPDDFQRYFDAEDMQSNRLAVYLEREENWRGPKRIFYLMLYQQSGYQGYIGRIVTPPAGRSDMHVQKTENQRTLLLVGFISLLVMLLAGALLLFWVSRPAARLVRWTESLTPESMQRPMPSFGYRELDELAAIINDSFRSLQEAAEREEALLRHTSHELRTPIAVVRSNSALLRKLLERHAESSELPAAAFDALSRLERAGLSMSHVTNTLLWLGRDDSEPLPLARVQLNDVVQQVVDELSYLLDTKDIDIRLETSSFELQVAEMPLRIVLGNLIRNAFQHTWSGRVVIQQTGAEIRIDNHNLDQNREPEQVQDLGFGLGMKLTERLTQRLHWHYQNQVEDDGHRVVLKPISDTSQL